MASHLMLSLAVLMITQTPPAQAPLKTIDDAALDRVKRYLGGFGAGKSSVKATGVVKDSSGRTLATFAQRRIGVMGLGGGDRSAS